MSARRILTLIFAAFVLAEARWHVQKREVASICDPINSNHSKILCYCIKDFRQPDLIKSADCFLTVAGVEPTDHAWNSFEQLKATIKITLTKSRGIPLEYIPTYALRHIDALVQLDVKYGNIEKIHKYAFANLSNIEEISLIDSQIKTLEKHAFAHHKDLIEIKLDKNGIVEINRDIFIDLPSLEKLYLTENLITTIHDKAFVHLSNLKELEINMNKLFSLNSETFSGLKKLQKLDLSNNNLEVIGDNTFYPLRNLMSLNLQENKIQMLDDKAFHGLEKLKYLSLAHNKLSNIANENVFVGLESLITLSLRGNEIKELNINAIGPLMNNFYKEDSHFDVEDNIFPCDCKLNWFMKLMNQTRSKNLKIALENLKCVPDNKLRDQWNSIEEMDKSSAQQFDEEAQAGNEYEYYDESQLNGKLFYTDVRELLNCDKNKLEEGITQKIAILVPADDKRISTPTTSTKMTTITSTPLAADVSTNPLPADVKKIKVTNRAVLDLFLDETSTSPKPEDNFENEIMEETKPKSFTTIHLVNVSAKPINVYESMAADEAKPDKLKTQRSFQAELKHMPSSGHTNMGCAALILLMSIRLFHLVY